MSFCVARVSALVHKQGVRRYEANMTRVMSDTDPRTPGYAHQGSGGLRRLLAHLDHLEQGVGLGRQGAAEKLAAFLADPLSAI